MLQIYYLGYTIGEGLTVSGDRKVTAFGDFPRPTNKLEIRWFFLKMCVEKFCLAPITDLLKDTVPPV